MRRAVWGLPQVGILANKWLRPKLAPFGYYKCVKTPELWYHVLRPISFTLVVDDFGIKYVGKEHADHLIASIKSTYKKLTEDWTGSLYCGITLEWDYVSRMVDISMPGYIKKKLQEYKHLLPGRIQKLPIFPQTKTIWIGCTSPPCAGQNSIVRCKGDKKNIADPWQHIILCTHRGYDYLDGVEFHSRRTDKSNRKKRWDVASNC
jgi:hypothetical protein